MSKSTVHITEQRHRGPVVPSENAVSREGRVDLREPFRRDPEVRALLGISRKEVIQPQVPLRLPCYDFAPVTELAFGRSLTRLGDGLRALPASMA